jgi:hypothetical protein
MMLTRTMATASLRTDSPKTIAYSRSSTPIAPMMDSVATGSVAEMQPAKRYASRGVRKSRTSAPVAASRNQPALPISYSGCPTATTVSRVPTTAKTRIVPRLLKNGRL